MEFKSGKKTLEELASINDGGRVALFDMSPLICYISHEGKPAIDDYERYFVNYFGKKINEGRSIFTTQNVVRECSNGGYSKIIMKKGNEKEKTSLKNLQKIISLFKEKNKIICDDTAYHSSFDAVNYWVSKVPGHFIPNLSPTDMDLLLRALLIYREGKKVSLVTHDRWIVGALKFLKKDRPIKFAGVKAYVRGDNYRGFYRVA